MLMSIFFYFIGPFLLYVDVSDINVLFVAGEFSFGQTVTGYQVCPIASDCLLSHRLIDY